LLQEKENSLGISKNYQQFSAKTGRLILNQSLSVLEHAFANLNDIFLDKNSAKYQKLKVNDFATKSYLSRKVSIKNEEQILNYDIH
jgi:hypothetical protein